MAPALSLLAPHPLARMCLLLLTMGTSSGIVAACTSATPTLPPSMLLLGLPLPAASYCASMLRCDVGQHAALRLSALPHASRLSKPVDTGQHCGARLLCRMHLLAGRRQLGLHQHFVRVPPSHAVGHGLQRANEHVMRPHEEHCWALEGRLHIHILTS